MLHRTARVPGQDGDVARYYQSLLEEKMNLDMNMKQHPSQRPVVGGIYRDKSGNSLFVVNLVGGKVLLEYANGTVIRVDARNWQQLSPHTAIY